MRLQQLDLIRYGKFSGRVLDFPRAGCDFHLVVGANEAGKSTLRRAVRELLFGMPHVSKMDFVHAVAELRLGAVIESAAGTLAFHRARGRKALRRPDDEALPDDALAPHLGTTTETLFKGMFSLDLAALLEGGQSILDARDDVGQLLFQSAAGLAGLGALRDALAAEAEGLYAPRKAGNRAFYQALDQHQAAKQALRGLTVNTRQWAAAREAVDTLAQEQAQAAEVYRTLAATRSRLERVRRSAPQVAQWRELQHQWQAVADAVVFAPDAAQRLAEAERALAAQSATLGLHRQTLTELKQRLAAQAPDDTVLRLADRIDSLAAQGHACAQHRHKLARAEQELQVLLHNAGELAVQLGWPREEPALRAQVPQALALKTLSALMGERGALLQARQSAQQNLARAHATQQRLLEQPATRGDALSPLQQANLQQALNDGQVLKGSGTRQQRLQAALTRAEAELEAALAALATWRRAVPALAAMALPGDSRLAALRAERDTLTTTVATARQQEAQAAEQARVSAQALQAFAAGHHVVTLGDVQHARQQRDGLWHRIKAGDETLARGAAPLDRLIDEADRQVDLQRDHAAESARLQALREAGTRDAATAAARVQGLADAQQALATFDARWAAEAEALGLPGLRLLDLPGWLQQRQAALVADATRQACAADLRAEHEAEAAARAGLHAALRAAGATVPAEASLPSLCGLAEHTLAAQQAARANAEARARQQAEAEHEQAHQALAVQVSEAEVVQWQKRWDTAVQAAALTGDWLTADVASGAIDIATQVLDLLAQADRLRQGSITTLQRELAALHEAACALPIEPAAPPDAAALPAWLQALNQRLQQAQEMQRQQRHWLADLQATEGQCRAAEAAQAATRASLATLTALAHSDDLAVVRECIARSDRRRTLEAELQQRRQEIVEHGDGLALDALVAEVDAETPEMLKTRLEALDHELAAAIEAQNQLTRRQTLAQAELDKVDGGSAVADAESRRLEALAQLGDAAERYATVSAAHRLLRWAIDRYRERKQGPLLQRASALFAKLTRGSFERLVPDFEITPPRLLALRASGERVGIEGLSEGTRDQLFLALRLAALEMQIEADRPLPFIADDLFVNFHDGRSRAGLAALGELAHKTQVIFLTHHEHLVPVAQEVVGRSINVIELG